MAEKVGEAEAEHDLSGLENVELAFKEPRWEQVRWAAAAFTEKLSKRLEAGAGKRSEGVEGAGARDAAEDEGTAEVEATAKVLERGSREVVDDPPVESEAVSESDEVLGEEHEEQ